MIEKEQLPSGGHLVTAFFVVYMIEKYMDCVNIQKYLEKFGHYSNYLNIKKVV